MITRTFTLHSFGLKHWSAALLCAVTMLIALCATSCSGSKRTAEHEQHTRLAVAAHADSLQAVAIAQQTIIRTTASVRADSLSMAIPMLSLRNLPAGAGWSKRKGRANLRLRVVHDTLLVDASCDSLQRLVELYESRAAAYQRQAARNALLAAQEKEQRKTEVRETHGLWLRGGIGLLLIIATAVFAYHRRWNIIKTSFKHH